MIINCNVEVKVQFTKTGLQTFIGHYTRLGLDYKDYLRDEYCIWELMLIFGQTMYMGCRDVPFVNNCFELDLSKNKSTVVE